MIELLHHLVPAFLTVLQPTNMAIILFGVVVGIVMGVLPGFGAAQALALMFPFTYGMNVATATLFMVAIYGSAEYGGSIPAILIRTPGTTSSAMTVLEGYPMAQKGLAGRALRLSLYSGVIGGFVEHHDLHLLCDLARLGRPAVRAGRNVRHRHSRPVDHRQLRRRHADQGLPGHRHRPAVCRPSAVPASAACASPSTRPICPTACRWSS